MRERASATAATGAGLTVGLAVAVAARSALLADSVLEFYPLSLGAVAGVVTAGLVLRAASPGRGRRVGALLAAGALWLVAVAVGWWVVVWRVPPWTLEGAWMWPTALGAGIAGALVLRGRRASDPGVRAGG